MTEACRAEKVRDAAGSFPRQGGFSLVELGIVLVIAGIMISLGYYSWGMVVEGRKNAATLAELRKAKACIVSSILSSGVYPSYTPTRTPLAATNAVDMCLNNRNDAYGNPIYFIEGVRSAAQGGGALSGGCLLPVDTAASNDPCNPSYSGAGGQPPIKPETGTGAGSSYALDRDGVIIQDVAFVLASFGRSGVPDNANLRLLFPAVGGTLSARMLTSGTSQPSFARTAVDATDLLNAATIGTWGNDIYLIVTYQEILGELAKARGFTGTPGL